MAAIEYESENEILCSGNRMEKKGYMRKEKRSLLHVRITVSRRAR